MEAICSSDVTTEYKVAEACTPCDEDAGKSSKPVFIMAQLKHSWSQTEMNICRNTGSRGVTADLGPGHERFDMSDGGLQHSLQPR